jgi:hypothetical protein
VTRSIRGSRRAAALLAGAAAATLLVSGCGAGQIAETAAKASSVPGVNIDSQDGSVAIRNLQVPYPGTKGYPAGGEAPLTMAIYNQTNNPVEVRVTSKPVKDPEAQVVWGRTVVLTRGGTSATGAATTASGTPTAAGATPTASAAAPSGVAGQQAVIEIPALASVTVTTASTELLKVVGLNDALTPGKSVNLTFEFSNGAPALTVAAPTGVPLSPAPRGTPAREVEGAADEGH